MASKKRIKKIIIVIAAVVAAFAAATAVLVIAWNKGAFLPNWVDWNTKNESREVNSLDLGRQFTAQIQLQNKKVTVNYPDVSWESPSGVLVQDYIVADIDHDSEEELMLLCWKIGRYGAVSPRFGKKEEYKWRQHIYIYDIKPDSVEAIWMASDIGMDVKSWSFDEKERLAITQTSGDVTHWDWLSWGLELLE